MALVLTLSQVMPVTALGTTPEAPIEEPFPAQLLSSQVAESDTVVTVEAGEGVLPRDSSVEAKAVSEKFIIDAVTDKVESDGAVAAEVKAFDVTLRDASGREIQPQGNVKVSFSKTGISSESVSVYHVSDDAGKVEAVPFATSEADTQKFEAGHFSIYAIVDLGEVSRLDVRFHKASPAADSDFASILVKKSDDLNAVLYDPGAGDIQDGYSFRGWTTEKNYTKATRPLTVEDVRVLAQSELQKPTFKEGVVLELWPIILKPVSVTYLDEADTSLGSHTDYLERGETSLSYTVNMPYTPPGAYQHFVGWHVNVGGDDIEGHAPDKVYANGTTVKLSGSVTFGVEAPEGHWLVFNENGKDATYISPEFIKRDDVAIEPTLDMKRVGYDFGGWYTDEACTPGHEFVFGNKLTDETQIYAKWTPKSTANYTVIIWKQNVDGNGYDYAESVSLTGSVGSAIDTVVRRGSGNAAYATVNGVNKRYTGFHLNDFTQNVTVAPEGNSLVNVYYDRNEVTITFRVWLGGWYDYRQMTGLYGSSLQSNGYIWPTEYWWYANGGRYGNVSGLRTTFMDAFLPPDGGSSVVFYGADAAGSTHVRFYKQNATDDGYTIANDVTTSGGGNFYISDKYAGFHASSYSLDGGSTWIPAGNKASDTGYYGDAVSYGTRYGMRIRYDRSEYSVLYEDGVYVDGNGNPMDNVVNLGLLRTVNGISYGADMASYNKGGADYFEPRHAGFKFEGWYADENCTQPFVFGTMNEGVTVYAKWRQVQYRVFLHPNVDESDNTLDWGSDRQQMNFRISYGEKISAPTGRREGYEFVGWYMDDALTQAFNADAFVLNDVTVTSAYDKTVDFTDPMDKYGNGATYNSDIVGYNGGDRFWIDRKFDLYAKWRKTLVGAKGVGVSYDANGGTNEPHDTVLYLDNSTAVAGAASTAPEGRQFKYWVVQKWDENQGKYVDVEVVPGEVQSVFPGDTFVVLKDNAKVEEADDNIPDHPSYHYTVQLRAEYGEKGSPVMVDTVFDANGGAFAGGSTTIKGTNEINEKVAVPADPTREGYTFKGWGVSRTSSTFAAPADPKLKTGNGYGYAADNLTGLAWDSAQNANVLYAVWEPKPVKLVVQNELEGSQADLTKKFDFTVSVVGPDGKEYRGVVKLGDSTLAPGDGETSEFVTLSAVDPNDGSTYTLRYGDTVAVSQDPAPGYSTRYQVMAGGPENGNSVSVALDGATVAFDENGVASSKVVFTNKKESVVVTGVKAAASTPLPWILLFGGIVALASVAVTRFRPERLRE